MMVQISDEDVQLLRDIVYILQSGRVGDLVHGSFPDRLEAFADRIDPQRHVRTMFGIEEGEDDD